MAYKYSVGRRDFGDIDYEGDDNTQIDFDVDFISLVTNGAQMLTVSGSNVGIGTGTPDDMLTINGIESNSDETFIHFQEAGSDRAKVGINTSNNLVLHNQYVNKHIVFKVNDAGNTREGLRINGAVPEVVVNESSESLVDFRVESDNNTHMLFVDGGNDKIGINTDQPTEALDINANSIRLRNSLTPSSAGALGATGQICWDANYLYICIATDTWTRIPHDTW
jgi:hypothetical protein